MAKKTPSIERGDHVAWNTPQGMTEGRVIRKHTRTARAGGHTASATAAEPQYEVKSDKTGKTAIHAPDALTKAPGKSSRTLRNPRAGRTEGDVDDRDETISAFRDAVNMTATQLKKWLARDESTRVGQARAGQRESVGHRSGRKIVELLGKKRGEYTKADMAHMRKVVGFVHRHLAQRPDGDVTLTNWRYSLMNWGHDPLKRS